MKRLYYLLYFFAFLSFNATAQNNDTDSLIVKIFSDEIMTRSMAHENLRILCKQIGPRLSGSDNARKAVEATYRMLKEAGADTVYLQPCMVPRWERGKKEQGYIKSADGKKIPLHLCALGNSVSTGKNGTSGAVIEVNNFSQLKELGESNIRGKIVFFNYPMDPTYIRTFKAYGESVSYRTKGAAQAAKYGAVAVLVRSMASNADDHPHTGVTIYNDSFPRIPAIAISTNDAVSLHTMLNQKKPVFTWIKTDCKNLGEVLSHNVIGEIRGAEFPSEIITVGGHLDSWDLAEGAHDDGAGCVQSIEIIRALKATGITPKRTVRAVMFMNEENGGKGAQAYLDDAKIKNELHIFALESDAGGFTPRGFALDMNERQRKKVEAWKYLFDDYGVYDFFRGGGGSDIGPLKSIGAALAGLSPDSQRYFDLHHAETDTFEAVSKRELDLGTVNMAALIWLVSEYGL